MAQKEIGRSGSGGLRVFVGWSSQEIETTERIEKKPYFPAAGNFFLVGGFLGLTGRDTAAAWLFGLVVQ